MAVWQAAAHSPPGPTGGTGSDLVPSLHRGTERCTNIREKKQRVAQDGSATGEGQDDLPFACNWCPMVQLAQSSSLFLSTVFQKKHLLVGIKKNRNRLEAGVCLGTSLSVKLNGSATGRGMGKEKVS